MSKVEASVVLITKRAEPRVDKALQLLSQQTNLNFEYIIVDGYYFQRKQMMEKTIAEANPPFPVLHLPDKPSRWHGRRPALSNARNTALIWARGKQIIFFDDCCVNMLDNLVDKHLKWAGKGYAVAGAWFTHPEETYGWEHRQRLVKEPSVVDGSWLYGGHMSFPLEGAIKVNGFDEMYDGEQGCDDCDFGIRLGRAGYQVLYDPGLYVVYDLSTHSLTQVNHDFKKSWLHEGTPAEPKKRVLKDGKEHFSNEFLIQLLHDDKPRTVPLGNQFSLNRLRDLPEELGRDVLGVHQELEKWTDRNPYDWRDNQSIEEMLK